MGTCREIPRVYVVGQTEPKKELFTPERDKAVTGMWILLNILKIYGDDEDEIKTLDTASLKVMDVIRRLFAA